MREVGLGLIGVGYMGKTHLRDCFNLKYAKLVAVSDISKKARNFAKRMRVKKIFREYQQLLRDSSVDAVIIALPTHLHASCVQEASEAGKDIFLEKPLARNVTEGKEIVSTVNRNGVNLMVGYHLRFCSSFRVLKEKMHSGILGEVQSGYASAIGPGPFFHRAEGQIPRPVPSWWWEKQLTGGGALLDQGSHLINLVRWYFGKVADIKSYLGYRFNLDIEDHATCLIKFATGQIFIINVGWFSAEGQINVELFGTVRHASAHHMPSNKIVTAIQLMTKRITPKFNLPYLNELQHFVDCVTHDLPPSTSSYDALKDLEIISLAYKNAIVLKERSQN